MVEFIIDYYAFSADVNSCPYRGAELFAGGRRPRILWALYVVLGGVVYADERNF